VRFALNAPFVAYAVTIWMTAAGLALIAGGLATLISLRSELFGSGHRNDDGAAVRPEDDPAAVRPEDDAAAVRPESAEPLDAAAPKTVVRAVKMVRAARAEPTQVVLSWPPINDDRPGGRLCRPHPWSTRNVNSRPGTLGRPRAVFPGRPGERPTVLENRPGADRPTLYISRHAAPPPT
jgi:hypothetical protein